MRQAMWGKCDECRRPVNLTHDWRNGQPMAAADYGASHFFCDPCLTRLELEQSILLGEVESIEELMA